MDVKAKLSWRLFVKGSKLEIFVKQQNQNIEMSYNDDILAKQGIKAVRPLTAKNFWPWVEDIASTLLPWDTITLENKLYVFHPVKGPEGAKVDV